MVKPYSLSPKKEVLINRICELVLPKGYPKKPILDKTGNKHIINNKYQKTQPRTIIIIKENPISMMVCELTL